MKVVIIGAGPAGLSCGYELAKNGVEVEVYESSSFIGGMARTINIWGQRVDLGPHRFFSNEKRVNEFFTNLMKEDYCIVNRITRIYYKNRFFDYPLRVFNILRNLSLITIIQIIFDYVTIMIFPYKNPKSFEEWVINHFGRKLYNVFFKHYSEKLWGIPGSKIDSDWAAQRIHSLSLWEAVISAIFGNIGNKHKTLVDQFAYPKNGTGVLYERAADFIRNNGGKVHLDAPVKSIVQDREGSVSGIVLRDGRTVICDKVISTMPLTMLINGLCNVPANVVYSSNQLKFRNTILIFLEVDSISLFKDNWIYVHSPYVKHGRITNFRNWSKELNRDKKTTILCMEFWAFNNDPIWKAEDVDIAELAKKEIRVLKLFSEDIMILNSFVQRVPQCYPVYNIGYKDNLKKVENFLNTVEGLYPIGRGGSFKYNNQDHSILMGLLAGDKIINGLSTNLWKINTDDKYIEESRFNEVFINNISKDQNIKGS